MRLLVSYITTIVIIITICDVESFDHMQRLYQLMHEKNITAPKIRDYGNITKHCKNTTKKCLWKCCNFGESVRRSKCIPSKLDNILNDVVIYDSDLQQTDKDLLDTFHLVPNHFSHKQFRMYKFRLNILFETYLSENGIVIIEMYNEFYRFYKIDVNSFCIDVNVMTQKVLIYGVIYNENDDIPELNTASHYYRIIALILCTILLIFVIAIYCIHPHLRDLHGMLVTTLLCCYLGKTTIEIIHHINIIQREFYSILESLHIFFNLTTFSFTNVMFHNVWKSIRSKRNAVNMRQNKLKQYFKYIAYGFGLPLILTITISIINFIDMTSIPWFITPKFYRRQTCIGKEMILYIYIPRLVMFLYNICLCCLIIPKAYEGFFGSLSMTYTTNEAIKYDKIRFSQYMKLMTFMTISEAANAYNVWFMKLYGIVSTNKWLLGVVIVLIFLRGKIKGC